MKTQRSKNTWDAAKVVLRGKFIAQKCYKLGNMGEKKSRINLGEEGKK